MLDAHPGQDVLHLEAAGLYHSRCMAFEPRPHGEYLDSRADSMPIRVCGHGQRTN
jgi:hypothetical protein